MSILIIDDEGNSVNNWDEPDISQDQDVPQEEPSLEEVAPDSDQIQREREEEQIIIAQILNHPLA
ncbi:hypothetical protein J7J83_01080 [bacterium]|nr:hypothetical protein [bacterium]